MAIILSQIIAINLGGTLSPITWQQLFIEIGLLSIENL
jgi:hypothetical protein